MDGKKRILLKCTGELLLDKNQRCLTDRHIRSLLQQIKQLQDTHVFGMVIGGGNFFRGGKQGRQLHLTPTISHQIGMLATMMNGLIVSDLAQQEGLNASLLCALPSPEIGAPISHQTIKDGIAQGELLIFSGGTGNPFFTTDTSAVLRALQMDADEIWKATGVPGVFTADPCTTPDAELIKNLSFERALHDKLAIMDAAAFALAQQYGKKIRVFDVFSDNALINAAHDETFGSTVH